MNDLKLFSSYKLGVMELKNRIVMSPMTRSRAINNTANDLIARYYEQRADAGLIITEGTSPSPNGLGYARIPGIFNEQQVEGWRKVTSAVHARGGKIVVQLMHTGRISHPFNMPKDATVLAPSAVKPAGQMWTDSNMMQDYPNPKAMSIDELNSTQHEFIEASKNAIKAGFDGIELHGANGYLLEQFLNPTTNVRTDNYGGSVENRCRYVIEVVNAVANAIGKEKTGIRLSPYGVASDMAHYPEIDATYKYLAEEFNKIGIAYIHIVDHSALGAPPVSLDLKKEIRRIFKNTIILAGGYDKEKAEADLKSGLGDLIGLGRPFINNPDLVKRWKDNLPLSSHLDMNTFYTPDEKGYTDYPLAQFN